MATAGKSRLGPRMRDADRSSDVLACGESGSTWSARAPSDITAPALCGAPVSTLLTTEAWRTPGAGVGGPRIVGLPAAWVRSDVFSHNVYICDHSFSGR